MAGESTLISQFQKAFQGMSATQKAMVGTILGVVLLALLGLGLWASSDTMEVLFSNLPPRMRTGS